MPQARITTKLVTRHPRAKERQLHQYVGLASNQKAGLAETANSLCCVAERNQRHEIGSHKNLRSTITWKISRMKTLRIRAAEISSVEKTVKIFENTRSASGFLSIS